MRIEWRTDRPPEEKEKYLVTYEGGDLDICWWTNVNMFWTTEVTDWHWRPAPYCEVVAWLPLPHAYIAEEEEEAEIIADCTAIACENCKYWVVEELPPYEYSELVRRCEGGFSDNDLYTFPGEYCSNWEKIMERGAEE